LFFVTILPLYANAIWNPNTTYYRALLPPKERNIIIEKENEDEEKKSSSDKESDNTADVGFEAKESNKKNQHPTHYER
jgi:hypothetical protein